MEKNFETSILETHISIETLDLGYEPVSLEFASQSFFNELREPFLEIDELPDPFAELNVQDYLDFDDSNPFDELKECINLWD